MAQTENLGLSLVESTAEGTTSFRQWSRGINAQGDGSQENPNSDMQKIDAEFGRIYGELGEIVLEVSKWTESDNVYTYVITMLSLGNNDAIFFSPSTRNSKAVMDLINCFVSSNGQIIVFEADDFPAEDITLNYRIVRGAK